MVDFMNALRVWCFSFLGFATLLLAACQTQPPRPGAHPAQKIRIAVALVSESGNLTEEQIQARRDEVFAYLRQRGLIAVGDDVTSLIATADRIIRVVLGDVGGFKITVFDSPAVSSSLSGSRSYYRSGNWSGPDPFFDNGLYFRSGTEPGYRPYQPNEVPRSRNPNAPAPDTPRPPPPERPELPRHTPPPRTDDTPRYHPPHEPRDTPPPSPPTYTPPPAPPAPPPRSDPPPSTPARDDKREDDRPVPAK